MKLHVVLLYVVFILCISLNERVYSQEEEDAEELGSAEDVENEDFEGQEEPPEEVVKEKINFTKPVLKDKHHLVDFFESHESFKKLWVASKSKKDGADENISKYDGVWSLEEPQTSAVSDDLSLVLKTKAKHHAVSRYLEKTFEFTDKAFVVQYEVKFQEGQECGGAYIKLLSKENTLDLSKFNDRTSYSIMFGPDKCGNDFKLHFIYRYKHPVTGEVMEKHSKKPSASLETYFSDKKTHLYTLVINANNYFKIFIDQYEINSGSLINDVLPPLIPEKEVSDPDDKKPADWDERERIADPDASKPEDWDESQAEQIDDTEASQPEGWLTSEPQLIPDPSAEKPSDWDEDMDGEWEAPLIANPQCESVPGCGEWKPAKVKNPLYKGKWSAPLIDNPLYKGVWTAKKIANPDFFEDNNPFSNLLPIAAVGLELWSMSGEIAFDNFMVTSDRAAADNFAAQTWQLKKAAEGGGSANGIMQSVMDVTQERPWLWAVIVVVIVLPVILLCAYCCFGSSKSDDVASPQHPKKTDETSPDDENTEEEDMPEDDEGGDEGGKQGVGEGGDAEGVLSGEKKVKKRTKADLETKSPE